MGGGSSKLSVVPLTTGEGLQEMGLNLLEPAPQITQLKTFFGKMATLAADHLHTDNFS